MAKELTHRPRTRVSGWLAATALRLVVGLLPASTLEAFAVLPPRIEGGEPANRRRRRLLENFRLLRLSCAVPL